MTSPSRPTVRPVRGSLSGRGISVALLLSILLGMQSLIAQSDSSRTPSSTRQLGNWWVRNASSYDPLPTRLLFHVEGDYSFSLQRGNVDGMTHLGRIGLYLRKGKGTVGVRGMINKQELDLADVQKISTSRYVAGATLDYSLSQLLGPQAGFYWEHDDAAFIETREIGYLGLMLSLVNRPNLVFNVLPAFGHQYEQAILTGEERSYWSPYLEESLTWSPSDRLSIHHYANVLFSAEDVSIYRWRIANGLELPLTDWFSMMINYEVRYNNRPIPTQYELQLATGGLGNVSNEDHEMTIGLRLQH